MRTHSSSVWNKRVAAIALLGTLGLPVAYAQTASSAASGDSATLEEVIVTAERFAEDVQKTPIAITTISGDTIAKHAETELDTALRFVPSLMVQSTPQGGEIYIRGVGANGDSNFVDPSVALHFDGVYTGRSERLAAPLYDINRIEVLRGPQGTIYGRNADGGAVNIVSNDPVIGATDVRVNVQLGDYSLRHVDGAVNIPISDQFAMRVAAERETRDGYFTNGGYGSDVTAFRVKALYTPTADLTVRVLYDYLHMGGLWATTVPAPLPFAGPPSFVFNSNTDFCAGPNGGWLDTQPNNSWYVDPCHPADHIDYKFQTLAAQVDYTTSWSKITFLPTYSESTRYVDTNLVVGDDPFFGGSLNAGVGSEHQKTAELRLASLDNSRIKWVVGYYYLWSDNTGTVGGVTTGQTLVGGVPTTVDLFTTLNSGASPTVSKAPFGQITVPVTDALRLTGGARYTQDTRSQAVDVISDFIPGYNSGNVVANANYSKLTYKAGLELDVAPQSMTYAQVTTGYKSGGFDTTATPIRSYQPESVTAYELGIKNRFLNNRIQLNADVYYYGYQNLQVQYHVGTDPLFPLPNAYLPVPPGGVTNPCPGGANPANNCYGNFQQYIANAGAGKNKGAEAEFRWRLTNHDELDLTATYADAHYGNFTDPTLSGLSGEAIAMTPRNTVIGNFQHDWNIGEGNLEAQIDSKWSASYWASVNNRASSAYGFQSSYTRSDASLTYRQGPFSIGAWIKNIENKAQLQFGDFPLNREVLNFPRTYGVNLSMKFGGKR